MRVGRVIARSVGSAAQFVKRGPLCRLPRVPLPDLLRALLSERGPSGHEEPAARVWREAAAQFAEVHSDTLGSSYARVRAGEDAPTLAIVGHIDEIGVAITSVDDAGLL